MTTDIPEKHLRWGAGTRNEDETTGKLRIIDAALQCYEAKGLTGTTLEDIAKQAGISRRTLYRYFANKQEIIEAVVEKQAEDFFLQMEKQVSRGQPEFRELLKRCMLYAIKHGPQFSGYQLLLQGSNANLSAGVYFSGNHVARLWHDLLLEPYNTAREEKKFDKDIKLGALIDWVGRLVLSYVQFPAEEKHIRKQLDRFLLDLF
jgi:AcrR family transcriptional regulator